MAPTCVSGPRGSCNADGRGGSSLSLLSSLQAVVGCTSIAAAKRALRRLARLRRAEAHGSGGAAMATAVARETARLALPAGAVVAGYWPLRDELDPRPAMRGLARRGHPLALPVVVAPDRALVFRAWCAGDPLAGDALGLSAPLATASAVRPDVVLVPLLAFDRHGRRLGYGAGYYDRTLAALRAQGQVLAMGLAYAAQEMPEVAGDGDDQPLDGIVTERGILWVREGGLMRERVDAR